MSNLHSESENLPLPAIALFLVYVSPATAVFTMILFLIPLFLSTSQPAGGNSPSFNTLCVCSNLPQPTTPGALPRILTILFRANRVTQHYLPVFLNFDQHATRVHLSIVQECTLGEKCLKSSEGRSSGSCSTHSHPDFLAIPSAAVHR